jgi:hypothetical protein
MSGCAGQSLKSTRFGGQRPLWCGGAGVGGPVIHTASQFARQPILGRESQAVAVWRPWRDAQEIHEAEIVRRSPRDGMTLSGNCPQWRAEARTGRQDANADDHRRGVVLGVSRIELYIIYIMRNVIWASLCLGIPGPCRTRGVFDRVFNPRKCARAFSP